MKFSPIRIDSMHDEDELEVPIRILSHTFRVAVVEYEGCSLFQTLRTLKRCHKYEEHAKLDNFRTPHEYLDGIMTSLHFWELLVPHSTQKLAHEELLIAADNARVFLMAFPELLGNHDAFFSSLKLHIDRLLIYEPRALILFVETSNNIADKSHRANVDLRRKQIAHIINKGASYSSVNVNNAKHLEDLICQVGRLALESHDNNKHFKAQLKYLENDLFPSYIEAMKEDPSLNDINLLRGALDTLELRCNVKMKKIRSKAETLVPTVWLD